MKVVNKIQTGKNEQASKETNEYNLPELKNELRMRMEMVHRVNAANT